MSEEPRRVFVVELVDCGRPDDVPVIIRLRAFLKAALRAYRLRCTDAREETPGRKEEPCD